MTDDELKLIIDKITEGKHTEAELSQLRQALIRNDNAQVSLQLGKFNVNIGEGKDIHIGAPLRGSLRDRLYYSWDDEALSALVGIIQQNNIDEASLLVTKLNHARLQGEEGDRTTGSFYTYNVRLEDVSLEKSHHSTENNRQLQQYTIKGKWESTVYKEINLFGLRVDYPWGKNKKPYGEFTVKIEILNGQVSQMKVNVARYDDSPNNYAADKAEQLIQSKISEVLRFV